ncbi:hypothetical protein ONZ43_g6717 [Nemania bipapillata]|uniref:Uncharacterized protein n=1 Tax=Nemania bipapillata TaxID=110536 RepID=A0ACC2HXJ1_9PEZI|nr:hypothetical protein ONZ43_g6717 [Nemania bipapillata]
MESGYVAKYIEVESGTYPCVQFAKATKFHYEGHHIAYSVQFDDYYLKLRHQPPYLIHESWEDATDSVVVGTENEQTSQLFRFENLTRVDDKECHNTGYTKTSSVGSIRVEYSRIALKKGAKIEDPEPEYEDDFLDGEELPFAVFDFYYRSQGIRSRHEIEEEEEQNMTPDELRAKLRRIREQSERDKNEDRKPDFGLKDELVKCEVMGEGDIEVIDLTGSP